MNISLPIHMQMLQTLTFIDKYKNSIYLFLHLLFFKYVSIFKALNGEKRIRKDFSFYLIVNWYSYFVYLFAINILHVMIEIVFCLIAYLFQLRSQQWELVGGGMSLQTYVFTQGVASSSWSGGGVGRCQVQFCWWNRYMLQKCTFSLIM